MNTKPNPRPLRSHTVAAEIPIALDRVQEQDFDDLSCQNAIVEHSTIPGFLRRIPHRWHLDEITRFGSKVAKVADSMQVAYLTTIDRSLGVIRVFPLPLLRRVYEILAPQSGWPQFVDAPSPLEDVQRAKDLLRANERCSSHLDEMLNAVEDKEVLRALTIVSGWVHTKGEALREKIREAEAA